MLPSGSGIGCALWNGRAGCRFRPSAPRRRALCRGSRASPTLKDRSARLRIFHGSQDPCAPRAGKVPSQRRLHSNDPYCESPNKSWILPHQSLAKSPRNAARTVSILTVNLPSEPPTPATARRVRSQALAANNDRCASCLEWNSGLDPAGFAAVRHREPRSRRRLAVSRRRGAGSSLGAGDDFGARAQAFDGIGGRGGRRGGCRLRCSGRALARPCGAGPGVRGRAGSWT